MVKGRQLGAILTMEKRIGSQGIKIDLKLKKTAKQLCYSVQLNPFPIP
jgi:hypothetical protein